MEIKNATTVHRIWRDGSTELLMATQYHGHAERFCEALAATEEPMGTMLAMVCHFDGKMTIFKPLQKAADTPEVPA